MTFEDFCKQFRLGKWREQNEYRRECERSIALHAVDTRSDIERLLHHWQVSVDYDDMNHPDRLSFRKRKSNARKVANDWHLLDASEQAQFRTGAMLPYRAAKIIRERKRLGR